jgi:hypothetical protein
MKHGVSLDAAAPVFSATDVTGALASGVHGTESEGQLDWILDLAGGGGGQCLIEECKSVMDSAL